MKKLVISAMALGLFLAAPAAIAAPNDHHHRTQTTSQQAHRATVARDRQAVQRSNRVTRRANHATRRAIHTTQRANRATHRANVAIQRANRTTRRANYATRRVNRAVVRTNFAVYQSNAQSSRQYRWNNYQRPNGWYSHRWTYGERLPTGFYSSNYWIADYISFGLMAPPSGLVWVRDDHDALLIDRYTGQIVRVRYNVFY